MKEFNADGVENVGNHRSRISDYCSFTSSYLDITSSHRSRELFLIGIQPYLFSKLMERLLPLTRKRKTSFAIVDNAEKF